jgi:hypothetical protein
MGTRGSFVVSMTVSALIRCDMRRLNGEKLALVSSRLYSRVPPEGGAAWIAEIELRACDGKEISPMGYRQNCNAMTSRDRERGLCVKIARLEFDFGQPASVRSYFYSLLIRQLISPA